MIDYYDGFFNITTFFRVYGSPTYKAVLCAMISSAIYIALAIKFGYDGDSRIEGLQQHNLLDHPYPVTVIVTSITIVLSAKMNFSYQRYWEATQALHNMHSKWLDVGSTLTAFHMQSKYFEKLQPPSYGGHQHLNDYILQRDNATPSDNHIKESDRFSNDATTKHATSNRKLKRKWGKRAVTNRATADSLSINASASGRRSINASSVQSERLLPFPKYRTKGRRPLTDETARTTTEECNSSRSTSDARINQTTSVPTLFLQEGAHLISLLSAVALSTLRCDEGSEAPLVEFTPGKHWPNFDSDRDPDRTKYGGRRNFVTLRYIFDVSRTRHERRAQNAARPFPVIGGISDNEAMLLRRARGSCAKTALVFTWLNEFIIREQLHGSLGNVAPPIVSRLQQYSSDGHLWYNSARKMSYIPFPFPITQMATLFVGASMFLIPFLMLSKTEAWFGLILNFLTTLLFAGLNEISRELEYPYRGMPNDLPLNLFQAQFNEALVTMFSGYHPDASTRLALEVDGDV